MSAKTISQKRFAKLVASTGPLSQPPGAITRASNLLFTTRGSLQICDGSQEISAISDLFNWEVISIFDNFLPAQFPLLVGLALNTQSAGTPSSLTATPVAGSGNPAGGYAFGIVGITADGGHSDMSSATDSMSAGATFSAVNFTWAGFASAATYQIWMFEWPALSGGSEFSGVLIASGITGTTYTFTGTLPLTPVAATPIGDSTHQLQVFISSNVGGNIVFVSPNFSFPSFLPQSASLVPGSPGFSYSTIDRIITPYGGVVGACDNIPQVIQFAGLSILILGNGYAPQAVDPTLGMSATATPLANTFQAAYPNWQPSVDWITGSQVTDGAGNYYTATQGGVSQTPGPPSWNTALGAETADGSVIWTSQGPIVASTAPRGAAHAVAYAGSLWLANTYPSDTSDGIDGPTCLKMSDSNNPNSWNPVNTAFIGRNDGTQITGLQPFTIAALGISPTGSLCVFKEFTTYQVIGVFGSTSFEIQPAQTNLGCLAARSIQFIPGFGVVRFTHLGFAVFDGINDRLISEDIRPYLFGGVDSEADLVPVDPQYLYLSRACQTTQPPMYLCAMPLTGANGAMTRVFCYDLVMKAWAVIDLPWAITSLDWQEGGEGYPLVLAGRTDGSVQRMQAGDVNWNIPESGGLGTPIQWSFRSPDVFGEGSSQRLFVEQVTIRGYGNTTMVKSIIASLWLDGQQLGSQAIDIVPMGGSNLFEIRIAVFRNGERFHLDVSGNNGGAAGVIDSLDWAVVPKSALARRIIS
jgi:hypothetical protein